MIPPKRFDISPPDWGVFRRSRCVQIFLLKRSDEMHGQGRCKTVRNGRENGLATVKVLPYYTIPAGDCLRYLLYEPPRGKHNTTSSPLVLLKSILINIYILCKKNRNGYFPHRWGILLFTHHLDLALEDSVGHSTCLSVLARRRVIMGWLVG